MRLLTRMLYGVVRNTNEYLMTNLKTMTGRKPGKK